MSNDSWSRIQATQKRGNDENFFAVRSTAPAIQDLPDYVGFSCDRRTDIKIVRDFGNHLKFFARVSKFSCNKEGEFWIIKVRLLCASDASLINKTINFQGVSFSPTTLKVVDRKRDTLFRLLSGDRSLFNFSNSAVIKTFSTDSVFCRAVLTVDNDIYCLYKLRQIKQNGKIVQERSPFWMFVTIYNDGSVSESEELQDIDSDNCGADITLQRLMGVKAHKTDWNGKHYNKGLVGIVKELKPTNPPPSVVRESIGIFRGGEDPDPNNPFGYLNYPDPRKECFPKLGKNCIPRGIQALKKGREMARGEDIPFWDNVTLDKTLEQIYLERQTKKSRKRFKKEDIIDLQLSE